MQGTGVLGIAQFVGAAIAAIIEGGMHEGILQISLGDQRLQRHAVRRIVQIAGNADVLRTLRAQRLVDRCHPLRLCTPLAVVIGEFAITFAAACSPQ
jgi:hypothetical protein